MEVLDLSYLRLSMMNYRGICADDYFSMTK